MNEMGLAIATLVLFVLQLVSTVIAVMAWLDAEWSRATFYLVFALAAYINVGYNLDTARRKGYIK